jgi:hypothetical protein
MNGAYSTHGRESEYVQSFGSENKKRPLENPNFVGWRVILKWILERIRWGGLD